MPSVIRPRERLDAVFGALADPSRRAILARLEEGEASVTGLAEPFAMSQPAISKHLKVLEQAGLVSVGREAQRRPRRLEAAVLAEADAWLARYRDHWGASFRLLDTLLEEVSGASQVHTGGPGQETAQRPESRPDPPAQDPRRPDATTSSSATPKEATMQRITPFLWFNDQAEEAMEFYTSVFKNSRKGSLMGPSGNAQGATFEIDGLRITAFNGGSTFKLNEAFSLMVNCDSQEDVDYYWDRLTDGGEESMCGWLKDKFGVSWQIVPTVLPKLLGDRGEAGRRATQAMLKMHKLDIAALQAAFDG